MAAPDLLGDVVVVVVAVGLGSPAVGLIFTLSNRLQPLVARGSRGCGAQFTDFG